MKKRKNLWKRLAALTLALCILTAFALPVVSAASSGNTQVQETANGVLQINTLYRADDNQEITISYGSSFLINSNTILTCAHCVDFSDADWEMLAEMFGKTVGQIKERISYSVTISRDVTVPATLVKESAEMDFAILTLQTSPQNREPLKLRSSSEVQLTETVYAVGFPALTALVQNINTYTSDDVTITNGQVNKIATGENFFSHANYDYIQTSCKLSSGNSGGPMVDNDGNVIGICQGAASADGFQDDYFYAVAMDQVIEVLDALGIDYTSASAPVESSETENPTETDEPAEPPVTEPVVEHVDKGELEDIIAEADAYRAKDYTEESYKDLSEALDDAISTNNSSSATQDEVDDAVKALQKAIDNLKEAKGSSNSTMLILLIAAAAVVVIVVVVIIVVVVSGKKKRKSATATPTYAASIPSARPVQPPVSAPQNAPSQAPNSFAPSRPHVAPPVTPPQQRPMNNDSGETTLLNQGAGETTLLSKNIRGGVLTRKKNGERIQINASEFIIGRQRNAVNYCIADNTSISRRHAKLVVRDGSTYLVDLGAANGTYVNGAKSTPNQEVLLKDGDRITLSEEDFEFRLS